MIHAPSPTTHCARAPVKPAEGIAGPPLGCGDGLHHPPVPRRRHRRRDRAGATPARGAARGRRAQYAARPRRVSACAVRRPDRAHDLAPRRDAFVAGAAVRRLVPVGVLPFARWSRGGGAAALVVGDLPVPDGASADRCVHGVRHPAVLATADAAADVVEPVHHRSVVHPAVVAGMRGRMVRARTPLRPACAGGRHRDRCRLCRLVVGRKGDGGPCRRARAGVDGPAAGAEILGADAVQHVAVARGGDDARRFRRRRALAGRRSRADDLPRLPVQHAGAGRSAAGRRQCSG